MKVVNFGLLLCLFYQSNAFVANPARRRSQEASLLSKSVKGTSLHMIGTLFPSLQQQKKSAENGLDEEYPWCFRGRLWFRPALVRVKDSNTQGLDDTGIISILNLFGYTIGGTVALQYDDSPVGPYEEYVSMGALVACVKSGMVGQWGSRLYVNTKTAEQIARDVWGVPAEVANIEFAEKGPTTTSSLQVTSAPDPLSKSNTKPNIVVTGWSNTRNKNVKGPVRGQLPVLWTPTVKALWVKLSPFPLRDASEHGVPVHKLRLSASSLKLQFCSQESSPELGIPIGIGLSVENVLIEIGRQQAVL